MAQWEGSMASGDPEEITPQRAAELVAKAPLGYVQQRLDRLRVAKYAALMSTGEWQPGPQHVIPVTADGQLIDGLNKLVAVIVSGTTQPMIVRTDVEPPPFVWELEATE